MRTFASNQIVNDLPGQLRRSPLRENRPTGGLESRFERTRPRHKPRKTASALRNPETRKEQLQEGYWNRRRNFSRPDVLPCPSTVAAINQTTKTLPPWQPLFLRFFRRPLALCHAPATTHARHNGSRPWGAAHKPGIWHHHFGRNPGGLQLPADDVTIIADSGTVAQRPAPILRDLAILFRHRTLCLSPRVFSRSSYALCIVVSGSVLAHHKR